MKSVFKQVAAMLIVSILFLNGCGTDQPFLKTSEFMAIEPGLGLGPIKLGMPMDEVPSILGEPDRRTGPALEYLMLGLAIVPGRNNSVGAIMAGDSGGGQLVEAFKGKTKEGLGMGATYQEIVEVFGESEPREDPIAELTMREESKHGIKTLNYQSGNLTFTLKDERLVHLRYSNCYQTHHFKSHPLKGAVQNGT